MVLDGGAERLARAAQSRQQFPLQQKEYLLIRCPRSFSVPLPMQELLQGYTTATQITATVAQSPPVSASPARLDCYRPDTLLVRLCWPTSPWVAVASRFTPSRTASRIASRPGECRKLVRDALRFIVRGWCPISPTALLSLIYTAPAMYSFSSNPPRSDRLCCCRQVVGGFLWHSAP